MAEDRKKTLRFKSLSTVFARLLEYCRNKRRRAAKTTLLQSFICKCATLVYIFIYQQRIFLKSYFSGSATKALAAS